MKRLFIVIFMIGIFSALTFFGGSWSSDNFNLDLVRVNKMVFCFQDGQFPCRWVGNYGSELGTPLFNYIAPLPYYIGGLIYQYDRSYSFVTKIIFLIPFGVLLISSWWLLSKYKKSLPMLLSFLGIGIGYWGLLFSVHVGVGFLWALASLMALLCLTLNLYMSKTVNNGLWVTLAMTVFLLSKQEALVILLGLVLVGITIAWTKQNIRFLVLLVLGLVLSIGVAAFYIFPMIVEADMVRLNSLNGDFLPSSVKSMPDRRPTPKIVVLVGDARIFGFEESSNRFRFGIDNSDHSIVRLATPYFPNWKIKANGVQIKNYYDNNSLGLMTIILGEGRFIVEGKLEDTPVREIANIVSVVSLVVLCFLFFAEMGRIRKGLLYYLKALHS